jgi:cell division protein FtsI (penicillin-binding protein 3)
VADKVSALKLPGIHQKNEYRRYYPAGEVMAHMLGFTGVEDSGQEGIELAFNGQLAGKPGSRRVIKDRRGNVVEDVESIRPPQEGKDIVLAIDSKLQYLAYSHLKQALENIAPRPAAWWCSTRAAAKSWPGQPADLQPEQSQQAGRRAVAQPGADRHLRARLDTEALHRRAGAGAGKVRFDTPIQTAPGK